MTAAHRHLGTALRALFFLGLVVLLVVTLIPMPAPSAANGDKVEHFAAFYLLTLLGACAFPRRALAALAVGLSAYGGLIEVLQGLPYFERSADVADWVADSIGIALAMAPMLLASWRGRLTPQ